eukprot:TRINITY_DN5925_c0_g1_i1.p1 TRINITY_DN5925_c0_g1~~TRINITY_DN5925_c0_g1_i1.p1  ORF type:complete len:164 (-),score=33.91 TRINITY_DN5925_c0_g1_i1:270-761(-)
MEEGDVHEHEGKEDGLNMDAIRTNHEEDLHDSQTKPKGILVKPGHKREKKSGEVVVAEAGPEKKAGQPRKMDCQKIEGREGVIVRKKSSGSLLRPKSVPNPEPLNEETERTTGHSTSTTTVTTLSGLPGPNTSVAALASPSSTTQPGTSDEKPSKKNDTKKKK